MDLPDPQETSSCPVSESIDDEMLPCSSRAACFHQMVTKSENYEFLYWSNLEGFTCFFLKFPLQEEVFLHRKLEALPKIERVKEKTLELHLGW